MVRKFIAEHKKKDNRIKYRGKEPSRLDTLTDAVFGIAITLLIFNINDSYSFSDLTSFVKTFPALLISIIFLVIIWDEHVQFSVIYFFHDRILKMLNVLFIALVIFYVYPLRFLTRLLTNLFFNTDIAINISSNQVPQLMIFYGFVVVGLYLVIYLFHYRVLKVGKGIKLNKYERFYSTFQSRRVIIMFSIPLLSIILTYAISYASIQWASIIGGFVYGFYPPAILTWQKWFKRKQKEFIEG